MFKQLVAFTVCWTLDPSQVKYAVSGPHWPCVWLLTKCQVHVPVHVVPIALLKVAASAGITMPDVPDVPDAPNHRWCAIPAKPKNKRQSRKLLVRFIEILPYSDLEATS